MSQLVYWLALWVGIMFTAFALMTLARVLAHLRKRRGNERVRERSVVPVLRFNLRKHFIAQIKLNAAFSLESMEPSDSVHRLRETLEDHAEMTTRLAAHVLEHIGTHSGPRRPARRSRAGFNR